MRIIYFVTGFLGVCILLLIGSIINHGLKMQDASHRLVAASEKVERLKKQQQELKQQIEQRNSPEYLEEQIRNKFNFVKEGERLVILPTELQPAVAVDEAYILPSQQRVQAGLSSPVWREWLELFL